MIKRQKEGLLTAAGGDPNPGMQSFKGATLDTVGGERDIGGLWKKKKTRQGEWHTSLPSLPLKPPPLRASMRKDSWSKVKHKQSWSANFSSYPSSPDRPLDRGEREKTGGTQAEMRVGMCELYYFLSTWPPPFCPLSWCGWAENHPKAAGPSCYHVAQHGSLVCPCLYAGSTSNRNVHKAGHGGKVWGANGTRKHLRAHIAAYTVCRGRPCIAGLDSSVNPLLALHTSQSAFWSNGMCTWGLPRSVSADSWRCWPWYGPAAAACTGAVQGASESESGSPGSHGTHGGRGDTAKGLNSLPQCSESLVELPAPQNPLPPLPRGRCCWYSPKSTFLTH